MIFLVDGEEDVPESLGADDVVEDGGPLQVQPSLQSLLPALRLPAHLEVEDDVAGPPEHVLQHGLHLAQRDPAVLLQDHGHRLEHADRGDDLRQLDHLPGLAGHLHRVGDVEELEHGGQGTLAERHLPSTATVALLRDDQPVVVVVVAPGQQEVVEIRDRLLDALSL